MKKIITYILSASVIICLFAMTADAAETDEEYYSELLSSAIDRDTAEKLEEIGLKNFTSDEIFSVSFSKIGEYFSVGLREKAADAISVFFRMLCVLVLLISVRAFISTDNPGGINIIAIIAVAILSVDVCNEILEVLLSAMKTSGAFILSFIPIYTVIIALGGNVSSAVTYNTVTFSFAQVISFLVNNYAADLTGMFLSLSMAFSVNSTVNLNRFISSVNKAVSTVVGFFSGGFAAMLSVRGLLSATIDSAASKSIKFLISSLIPIVGSSISDAYSTVVGSINVIKSSVAVAGIIIVLVITVPPILEGALYCVGFSALSYISEMAQLNEISSVFKAFQSALRTIILLNIFQLFLLIVSTGIMLTVKGGA